MTDDNRPPPTALRPKPKRKEKTVEKPCVLYWQELGLIQRKVKAAGMRAWPDRCFINVDGLHLYIEFKRPGELPNPEQLRVHNALRNNGCHVYTIDNIKEGKALLRLFSDSARYIANIHAAADLCAYERAKSEGKIQ